VRRQPVAEIGPGGDRIAAEIAGLGDDVERRRPIDTESAIGETNGRRQNFSPRQLAEPLMRQTETVDRPWDRDRLVTRDVAIVDDSGPAEQIFAAGLAG
jgi:hypothetical protein